MSFKFYCTGCGATIRQETVLFNMQSLVLEDDEQSFRTFSMYMTLAEIEKWLSKGKKLDSGYTQLKLSFSDVMGIISGPLNLNNQALRSLSLAQVKEYLKPVDDGPVIKKSKKKKMDTLDFGMGMDFDEPAPEETPAAEEKPAVEEKPAPEDKPDALKALSRLWSGTGGDSAVEQEMRSELENLVGAFGNADFIEIQVDRWPEVDNDGHDVVTGFQYIYPRTGKHATRRSRVCPKCKQKVYEQAGLAEHQTIVFMGTRGSGKTSTILAMTHLLHNSGHPIWRDCKPLGNERVTVQLLDIDRKKLMEELNRFEEGIAPKKTDKSDRTEAYSATFWIQDATHKRYLLTLTDMPGELMSSKENPARIDEAGLRNSHEAALCCDGFVICFDATTVFKATDNGDGGQEMKSDAYREVTTLVEKLDQLQNLRNCVIRENQGVAAVHGYVPTLIQITKDAELERQNEPWQVRTGLPLEKLYCFQAEREFIARNRVYNSVMEVVAGNERLRKAYHAMLRCSPFGYMAPSREDLDRDPTIPYHAPEAKNVEETMRGILKLVGVLPAAGALEVGDEGATLTRPDYHIGRVQYRSDKPKDGEMLEEALCRCTLFENPGYFDAQVLETYDEGWMARKRLDLEMAAGRKKNDDDLD